MLAGEISRSDELMNERHGCRAGLLSRDAVGRDSNPCAFGTRDRPLSVYKESNQLNYRSFSFVWYNEKSLCIAAEAFVLMLAERTGLEPATPGVTGRYSNQLNYRSFRITFTR